MNAAQFNTADALRGFLTVVSGHPLLERLFFASVEFALLAVLVFAVIRVGRIRSARLASLLWLLVLAKPIVSLAIGSPLPLVRMEVPYAAVAVEVAPSTVAMSTVPPTTPERIEPPPPFERPMEADPQPSPPADDEDTIAADMPPQPRQEVASARTAAPALVAPTAPVPSPPASPAPSKLPTLLVTIWLSGAALFAGRSLLDRIRVRRLVRGGRVPDANLATRYSSVAAQLQLKRPARLRVTSDLEGPALVGSIFPTVLIPDWLAADAQPNTNHTRLDWALRHELMHWKLHDPLAGLIREVAQLLFYFHPAAWWAGHRWEVAAEQACDRAIVTNAADSLDYAEQLYGILVGMQGRLRARIGTGLFATRTQIGQRIAALLNGPRSPQAHLSMLALITVTVVAAVTLCIGGAFADKNAARVASDESERAETVASREESPVTPPAERSDPSAPATKVNATLPSAKGNNAASRDATTDKLRELHGIVVTESGAPVSGATVTVRAFQFSKTVHAAADGTFTLAIPNPRYDGFLLAADPSGRRQAIYVPKPNWQESPQSGPIRLVLKTAREIPVTVNDATGRPVAGAVVAACAHLQEVAKEISDSAGRAVLRFPADTELQAVLAVKPDVGLDYFAYAFPWQNSLNPYLLPRGDARPVKFVLNGTKTARLRFVDGRQRPIVGMRVAPWFFQLPKKGSDINVQAMETFTRTTDANGVATFATIPADNDRSVPFVVNTKEYAVPNRPVFDPKATNGEITAVLPHKEILRGSVSLPDGKPAAGADVDVGGEGYGAETFRERTKCDEQGQFEIHVDPDMFYVFVATKDRYVSPRLTQVVRAGEAIRPVRIMLQPGARVHGRWTLEAENRPHQAQTLSLNEWVVNDDYRSIPQDQRIANPNNVGKTLVPKVLRWAKTDDQGRYEIYVAPETYYLAANYFGDSIPYVTRPLGRENAVFEITDQNGIEIDFRSERLDLRELSGRVVLKSDPTHGVRDATLEFVGTGQDHPGINLWLVTDAQGRFRGKRMPIAMLVHARSEDRSLSAIVRLAPTEKEPVIPLGPTASAQGRVLDNATGRPVANLSLRYGLPFQWGKSVGWEFGGETKTDAHGEFTAKDLTPGWKYELVSSVTFKVIGDVAPQSPGTVPLGDLRVEMAESGAANDERAIAPTSKPVAPDPAKPPAAKTENADANVIHGRVLLPDGRPAAGARVLALRRFWTAPAKRRPLARTTAGPDGKFTIAIPANQPYDGTGSAGRLAWIAAEADGFGAQWTQWNNQRKSNEAVLKLLPDWPIHGRIVDLEGRPVSNVRVKVEWQESPTDGLDVWLQAVKSGKPGQSSLARGLEMPGYEDESQRPTVTNDDGRFTLTGIGADRAVRLGLWGETIAYAELDVVTRAIPRLPQNGPFAASGELYGSEFTYQAAPTQPVVGTVRDASSGAPLAGVTIESRSVAGVPRALDGILRTVTDAQGNYRLLGMPKGNGGSDQANAIGVLPNEEQPYFMLNRVRVPETAGLNPTRLDFKLTRGVWVTGRLTERVTGAPYVPSRLEYIPSASNALAAKLPEFKRQGGSIWDLTRHMVRADGTFRLVALPGRGLVAAWAIGRPYRIGVGAATIAGMTPDGGYPSFSGFNSNGANAVKEINPTSGAESVTCDLVFEQGGTVQVSLVDAEGKPVSPCQIMYSPHRGMVVQSRAGDSTFKLNGLSPNESWPVMIEQPRLRIGKVLIVHYDEKSPGALSVTLEPCATVKGRLLDEDGVPFEHVSLTATARGGDRYWLHAPGTGTETRSDGRFVLNNIPPGAEFYSIDTSGIDREVGFETVAEKVVIADGKTIDLGDIKLKRKKSTVSLRNPRTEREASKTAKNDAPDANVVHGRVLLPDGRPAAGARVLALRWLRPAAAKRIPLAKTTCSPDGQFTIRVPRNVPYDGLGSDMFVTRIMAEAEGFGAQGTPWQKPKNNDPEEVVLKLVPEMPIRGRIVDLEGKPVRGARVTLLGQQAPRQEFGAWLEAARSGSPAALELAGGDNLFGYDDDWQPPIVTDQDGRFTVRGVGADRVAHLAVRGETIAAATLDVITRAIKPFARKMRWETTEMFGADFTYHAAPTRPIVGTVRDAATGAPLAGVTIEVWRGGAVRTETDAEGKYRLVGMPKGNGRGDSLVAVPNQDQQPYFRSAAVEVPDSPGLGPVSLDFKLTRGIWISGRVTDKATGAPALAQVFYLPTSANPNAAKFAEFDPGAIAPLRTTKPDGSFRHLAMPGRGVVWARGLRQLYRSAGRESKTMQPAKHDVYSELIARGFGLVNALHEFDARPGSESVACDLALDPGGVIPLSIVDPVGKPVSQCSYVFQTDAGRGSMTFGAAAPFEMRGMEPNESRGILFRTAKPSVGKVQVLHYDDKAAGRAVTVKLEPYGTVKGRLLDEEGMPLKFVNVDVVARGDNYVLPPFRNGLESQADGRFVLNNVAAGAEYYEIYADGFDEPIAKKLSVSAGQTIDLGDIKRKSKDNRISSIKPDQRLKATPPSDKTAAAEINEVHGRVLLPDGRPAAGARVLALRRFWTTTVKRTPLAKTIAEADGKFVIRFSKSEPHDGLGTSAGIAWIAAEADGFGPGWQQWRSSVDGSKELQLKLVPEVPIHGRIVDLEGKPVRDARVTLLWQLTPDQGLNSWLGAIPSGNVPGFFTLGLGLELQGHDDGSQPPILTDHDGRFTLRGIGAERVAHLALRGETIAYAEIDVVTRAIEPITRKAGGTYFIGRVYGADFTCQAVPTQPVVGTVRDATTGAPLAGVRIESRQLAGLPRATQDVLQTVTDADGRYRLVGMPKVTSYGSDDANAIGVTPNDDQPYFMMNWLKLPETPGLGPTKLDFKLTRGLWITGRVTDKSTGAPVSAILTYSPSLSNPIAAKLPEFKRTRGRNRERYRARPDGTFRLVGLPGRGLVSVRAPGGVYRTAVGGAEIPGMTKDGRYPTLFGFEPFSTNAMQEINPSPGTESVVRDFALDPGGIMRLSFVDRAGKPVTRCFCCYGLPQGGTMSDGALEPTFELKGLDPKETRPLLVVQTQQHLGKVFLLRYDEKGPHAQTVTLDPCATVKGRLVDEDGVPFKGENLSSRARGASGYELLGPDAGCDSEGRFQFTDLPPGAEQYTILTSGFGKVERFAAVADKVAVAAGQTIDLGDIKLKRRK
jgi:beta-lactamase regulating signal transducer with metallopeptidase domain/protocatechuate 3,4-dioxygenase beta subunit